MDFNIFVVKVYTQNWFTCTIAANAPGNDLRLIEALYDYRKINARIADEVSNVFSLHLWYLSNRLIGLSFFDERIDIATRIKMVRALKKPADDSNDIKNVTLDLNRKKIVLTDLINKNTMAFFKILSGNDTIPFLNKDPSTWKNDEFFNKMAAIVKDLAVVNDNAERAVGLAKRLNNKFSKDPVRHNEVIQVVEDVNAYLIQKNQQSSML